MAVWPELPSLIWVIPGEDTLTWIRDIWLKTNGRRLRWMQCMLSSEAPFHYLTAYWRGRREGFWE